MSEDKKKEVKEAEAIAKQAIKEELTKEELQVLANMVAQAQTQVQTAPKLIELVNKLMRMAKE